MRDYGVDLLQELLLTHQPLEPDDYGDVIEDEDIVSLLVQSDLFPFYLVKCSVLNKFVIEI